MDHAIAYAAPRNWALSAVYSSSELPFPRSRLPATFAHAHGDRRSRQETRRHARAHRELCEPAGVPKYTGF